MTGARTATGEPITAVQELRKMLYALPHGLRTDGAQWDRLFSDGEHFAVGSMDVVVLLSPCHTLYSVTYIANNAAFIQDTMFMPDSGTARADFPGADARHLWRFIKRIIELPDEARLFAGYDYRPSGREVRWESMVAAQKACKAHLIGHDEDSFLALRTARDRSLPVPALILSACR